MEAFVFPGQGSQSVGMGKALFETFYTFKETIEEASDILSLDIKKLIFEGPESKLAETNITQPCILSVSYAIFKCLQEASKKPIPINAVAGHSMGEYTALLVAGALDFSTALKLVKKRGELMKIEIKGCMAAIIGLDTLEVRKITINLGNCVIANDNCPGQIVISGLTEGVEEAMKLAKEKGAKLVKKLKVSGPFHSPWMKETADTFKEYLNTINFNPLKVLWYPNVLTQPLNNHDKVKELLIAQLTGQVRWTETIQNMYKFQNIHYIYEIGPGKVLSGLIQRINPEIKVLSINTPHDIQQYVEGK